MRSIIQSKKECYLCRYLYGVSMELSPDGLEIHHVFFGHKWRKLSDKYGLTVYLCAGHHRLQPLSAHQSKATADLLKAKGQEAFEKKYGHEKFMQVFEKNYL